MSSLQAVGDGVVFNHLGQCVTNLARSRRFYTELLGFREDRELQPPDEASATLLGLEPPLGMTAVYLVRDGLVLELLHFSDRATAPSRPRTMDEPGLTHLSLSVDDVAATCARVPEYGGEVLSHTDIGAAIFIRDPDGQLIELLPMAYRAQFADPA